MNAKEWLNKVFTEKRMEKLAKCLMAVLIIVFSVFVLSVKVPETKLMEDTKASISESTETVMEFSGATVAASLALSAFPNDFATPLAGTLSDLNTYFIFIFAVLFVEKLLVIEGVKIAFVYIIPAACVLYILYELIGKEFFKNFAIKLLVLGLAVVFVIPISTHFTEIVCADYLAYVDETIAEANAGADKVNEVMDSKAEEATIFDKLSEAFKTAIQGVSDLLDYFEGVLKRCVNSIAIMIVTTFVLPMLTLFLFRWLLNELFAWNLPKPQIHIEPPKVKIADLEVVDKKEAGVAVFTDEEKNVLNIEDKGEKS